jgi:hypothetical protein
MFILSNVLKLGTFLECGTEGVFSSQFLGGRMGKQDALESIHLSLLGSIPQTYTSCSLCFIPLPSRPSGIIVVSTINILFKMSSIIVETCLF